MTSEGLALYFWMLEVDCILALQPNHFPHADCMFLFPLWYFYGYNKSNETKNNNNWPKEARRKWQVKERSSIEIKCGGRGRDQGVSSSKMQQPYFLSFFKVSLVSRCGYDLERHVSGSLEDNKISWEEVFFWCAQEERIRNYSVLCTQLATDLPRWRACLWLCKLINDAKNFWRDHQPSGLKPVTWCREQIIPHH